MKQGLVPENHFEGHKNLSPEVKGKSLVDILKAIQNDLVATLGIKGVQTITLDDPAAVASADASDEATLVTLANEEKASYNSLSALVNDVCEKLEPVQEVDIVSPKSEASTSADASTTATAITLLNEIKAKYNVLATLANEIKSDLNTEATVTIAATDAATEASADASDEATAITLANSLKTNINAGITLGVEFKTDLNAADKVILESRSLF